MRGDWTGSKRGGLSRARWRREQQRSFLDGPGELLLTLGFLHGNRFGAHRLTVQAHRCLSSLGRRPGISSRLFLWQRHTQLLVVFRHEGTENDPQKL